MSDNFLIEAVGYLLCCCFEVCFKLCEKQEEPDSRRRVERQRHYSRRGEGLQETYSRRREWQQESHSHIREEQPEPNSPRREDHLAANDRQGNNCPQSNATSRDNRCNDIFFIEPNSQEAARIRAQLEKDDKDLPSYDEVMRIANMSAPTAAPATGSCIPTMPSALTMGASSSSVNTNHTMLPIPTYREVGTSVRPLTPPPYTPEPIGATVVVPITTPLHPQQNTQNSS